MKFVAIVLAASMPAAPVHGEWFDKGKAAFSNSGGKWRKAAINIEEGKLEVYSRGDRGLVAEFNEAAVEHRTWVRRRGKEGLTVAAGGFAGLGLGYALAKGDEGTGRLLFEMTESTSSRSQQNALALWPRQLPGLPLRLA